MRTYNWRASGVSLSVNRETAPFGTTWTLSSSLAIPYDDTPMPWGDAAGFARWREADTALAHRVLKALFDKLEHEGLYNHNIHSLTIENAKAAEP